MSVYTTGGSGKMKTAITVTIILCIFQLITNGCKQPLVTETADQYTKCGIALNLNCHFEQAILEFNKAIELDSRYADAYFHRGIAYITQNSNIQAVQDVDRATDLDPEYGKACSTYSGTLDFDRALAEYNEAIRLNPEYAAPHIARGFAYLLLGHDEMAMADFDKAVELEPDYALAYVYRGTAYGYMPGWGTSDKSISDFNKAIEIDPQLAIAYLKLAREYYPYEAKHDEAIIYYNKAIELDPDYTLAYFLRGTAIYYHTSEASKATSDIEKCIELSEDPLLVEKAQQALNYIRGEKTERSTILSTSEPTTEGQLSLSGYPVLGESVKLIYNFALDKEYKGDEVTGATAQIILPKEFELVEGHLEWEGTLRKGMRVEIAATVRSTKVGEFEIKAISRIPPHESNFGSSDTLYVGVFSDRGLIDHSPLQFPGDYCDTVTLRPADERVMDIALSISGTPALNQPVDLICTIKAIEDMHSGNVLINLHDGFEYMSGDLEWHGDLSKGEQTVLRSKIKSKNVGRWHVSARGYYLVAPDYWYHHQGQCLRIYVFEDNADVIHMLRWRSVRVATDLSISPLPAVNQTAGLICTLIALSEDVANVKVVTKSPGLADCTLKDSELEWKEGDKLKWEGGLTKNVPVSFLIGTIKPNRPGLLRFEVEVFFCDEYGRWSQCGRGDLWLEVFEDGAKEVPPIWPENVIPEIPQK